MRNYVTRRSHRLFMACVCAWLCTLVACTSPPGRPDAGRETRERAYRANNVGVALLEQLRYPEAAAAFRDALTIDDALGIAHLNLSLALLYSQDYEGARREAEAAAAQLPDAPQPLYVLGLIARSQSRNDVARSQFERVRQMEPTDSGAAINVAQIALEDQRYADAVAALRPVVEAEPSNVTAAYVLGLALTRGGASAEGQQHLERAQALRRSGYAVTFGTSYLEQGHLAEAIASTGREADLVPAESSRTRFTANALATAAGQAVDAGGPSAASSGTGSVALTLLDFEGDGDLDAVTVDAAMVRSWRNDGDSWSEATASTGLTMPAADAATGAVVVAGDVDNDGASDLLLVRGGVARLYRNDRQGHFSDVSAAAGIMSPAGVTAAAFADLDHDGDVDIVQAGPGSVLVLRNNRDGSFTDATRESRLAPAGAIVAVVPTDYDNHRDIDLLFVARDHGPQLFANQRDGSFRNVSVAVGLSAILEDGIETAAAGAGDLNKDDAPDLVLATSRGIVAAMSDGRGRFTRVTIADAPVVALQVLDYDNDGLLDVIGWGSTAPRVWRQEGRGWREVTASAVAAGAASSLAGTSSPGGVVRTAYAVAAADLDGDADTDLLTGVSGSPTIWRNSGDPDRHGLRVSLAGLVSNRTGIGAKVQVRAGSLSSRAELSAASPPVAPADVVFGLGARAGADVVRVLWPSGILQAEVATPAAPAAAAGQAPEVREPATIRTAIRVEELDRKPSSCPFLFTWNGERYEFVTDFLGGGEMGGWIAPGTFNRPDPVEYVRIQADQLLPRDGRFSVRITNELEETLYLDAAQLVVVAHPRDVFVFPNEGMTDPPKPHRLHTVSGLRPPIRVSDEHGHDVTDRVARQDWRAVDDFALEPIRGYARPHVLTIDIGAASRPVLLLTAWTHYAFSSDNVAARQAGLVSEPPGLEVRTTQGAWRRLPVDIGLPVGRPQTIAVDLTGHLSPGEHELRLSTNMRVYWDRIAVADATPALRHPETLVPAAASLRARGFSAELRGPGPAPLLYDYARVSPQSPWKAMAGRFTREGDVLPLLEQSDDRFVIARPGDEIALEFPAGSLTPLPDGWTRTYLLRADGFSKEMDPNSASPHTVEPLPFHRMTRYPYDPARERYPETEAYSAYRNTWNTRPSTRTLPPLVAR